MTKEYQKEYQQAYRAANKEQISKQRKEWYAVNKEIVRERHKLYFGRDPEKVRACSRRKVAKKREFKARIKLHYGCQNPDCPCVGKLSAFCLDFHHLGDKKYNVAMNSLGLQRVITEINKCTVLCAICHRMETAGLLDASQFHKCCVDEKGNVTDEVRIN